MWRELGVLTAEGAPPTVFEDQYISAGGLLAEILLGRDRMVIDVRPEAYRATGLDSGVSCGHPYDLCTELIMGEAGAVVETPMGRPLRAPLDTDSAVSWAAYANPQLARKVRPVLRKLLRGI